MIVLGSPDGTKNKVPNRVLAVSLQEGDNKEE